MDRTSHSNPHHPLNCQALGTPMLVPTLQAQVGTYSGHLVCLSDRTFHPPVFQDATKKGLPAPHSGIFILVITIFFLLDIFLLTSPKEQMPGVSGMTAHGMPFQPHLWLSMDPPTPSSPLPHTVPCPQEVARLESTPLFPK